MREEDINRSSDLHKSKDVIFPYVVCRSHIIFTVWWALKVSKLVMMVFENSREATNTYSAKINNSSMTQIVYIRTDPTSMEKLP
mmetsp:Transcript_22167/g.37124  ORF Transcript_22167/g.37124 Transcript_22167/m.37124 type:complete len:84 (-) Transcript_22167:281-532(-)